MVFSFIFNLIFCTAISQASSINHIGLSCNDIKEIMAKQETGFYFNRELELKKAKIIKYEDESQTKTLIYVFDKKGLCKYYMVMYDFIYFDSVIKELNECCEKQEEESWIETYNGVQYNKFLKKEDWYFTVITQKAEK